MVGSTSPEKRNANRIQIEDVWGNWRTSYPILRFIILRRILLVVRVNYLSHTRFSAQCRLHYCSTVEIHRPFGVFFCTADERTRTFFCCLLENTSAWVFVKWAPSSSLLNTKAGITSNHNVAKNGVPAGRTEQTNRANHYFQWEAERKRIYAFSCERPVRIICTVLNSYQWSDRLFCWSQAASSSYFNTMSYISSDHNVSTQWDMDRSLRVHILYHCLRW